MEKREKLVELKEIVENICKDGVVDRIEIEKMQDWLDENAFCFVGEEYIKIIIPFQLYLENGEFCKKEQEKLLQIINRELE